MATSIGLRVYQITAHKRRERTPIGFASADLTYPTPQFLSKFVSLHADAVQNNERERSWFFEPKKDDGGGNTNGLVQYGTFGFESNLKNHKTKKQNYRRKVDDVEEVPLYYEIWCPPDTDFGLIAFQSFQGRSCIQMVLAKIQDDFEKANNCYTVRFKKLLPNDVKGSLYYSAPVKRLTLIRRNAPDDLVDRYFSAPHAGVDLEVSVSARRGGNLGALGAVLDLMPLNPDGVALHDGIAFNEAVAQIKVGGRQRRVGVFGSDSEAGVIDLTESITRGPDGHPTFDSIASETDAILQDFFEVLTRR